MAAGHDRCARKVISARLRFLLRTLPVVLGDPRLCQHRKRGTGKRYVYTFIADRPIRSLKDKIRALTNRTSQQDPGTVLIRLNQIMRGWANYFKHAVSEHTATLTENSRLS